MAVVKRELYQSADIHSYFTGGVAEYEGELYYIESVDDRRILLNAGREQRWVDFDNEDVTFPHPAPGCFQCGDHVEILTKEPIRQWKKAFRLREVTVKVTAEMLSSTRVGDLARIGMMLYDEAFGYDTALINILEGNAVSHVIDRNFYLQVSPDGRSVEVYHRSSMDLAIGLATNGCIHLYSGACMFKEQLEKYVRVQYEDQ